MNEINTHCQHLPRLKAWYQFRFDNSKNIAVIKFLVYFTIFFKKLNVFKQQLVTALIEAPNAFCYHARLGCVVYNEDWYAAKKIYKDCEFNKHASKFIILLEMMVSLFLVQQVLSLPLSLSTVIYRTIAGTRQVLKTTDYASCSLASRQHEISWSGDKHKYTHSHTQRENCLHKSVVSLLATYQYHTCHTHTQTQREEVPYNQAAGLSKTAKELLFSTTPPPPPPRLSCDLDWVVNYLFWLIGRLTQSGLPDKVTQAAKWATRTEEK